PAALNREFNVLQVAAFGSIHREASCPPCAPSTMTNCGFLAASELASDTNLENSIVVFDMPTEIRTILPRARSREPVLFSGSIWLIATSTAAFKCAAGGLLLPFGYSPADTPL